MMPFRLPLAGLFALTLAAVPVSLLAAGSATLLDRSTDEDSTFTVLWQDDGTLRMNMDPEQPKDFMLIQGDKAYAVSYEGGTPMVLEVGAMIKTLGAFSEQMQQGEHSVPVGITSVKSTGRTENVAGLTGRVYQITVKDDEGKSHSQEVVLTDDARAVEMTRVVMGNLLSLLDQGHVEDVLSALPEHDRGLLRYGDDYVVTRVSGDEPDPAQFKLPAQPMDLGGLLQQLR